MATVAVDIDETLYSFDSAVRDAFFDMAEDYEDKSILRMAYSNNLEWRNLVDHDKKLAYEAIERVHSSTPKYELFPGAKETLEEIHEVGHTIKYIGTRWEKHQDVTREWLFDKNDLPAGNVVCADPTQPKNNSLGECQYLIDDRPKTILDFLYDDEWDFPYGGPQENHRKAFALWRPYNQNLTEVKNLYLAPTWRGLRYYLERKGVIYE